MDDRVCVIHCDLAQLGVARGAGRPEEQGRRLQAVDARFGASDVGAFLGLRAEGDELEAGRVEAPRQAPRRLDGDLLRPRCVVEDRRERGAVVRGKGLEHRLRADPRAQPLGPWLRPRAVARVPRRRRSRASRSSSRRSSRRRASWSTDRSPDRPSAGNPPSRAPSCPALARASGRWPGSTSRWSWGLPRSVGTRTWIGSPVHPTAPSPVVPGMMADLIADDVRSAPRGESVDLKLSDKVVLVTGAGQGLGRAIGLAFAGEGARVAFHYHSSAEGAEAGAAEARALGVKATAIGSDLRMDDAVADAVERVEGELGAIDVLVNNAAATQRKPFLESTPQDWAPQVD